MINTVILLSSVLASVRPEVMTRGEAVSVVFPVQDDKVLVKRQSENIDVYNDNIAVDSSTAVSKVAPMMVCQIIYSRIFKNISSRDKCTALTL